MTFGQLVRNCGVFVTLSLFCLPIQAVDVTLSSSDLLGDPSVSFDTAGRWNNGLAPTAGNNYFTIDFTLRTPTNINSHTFAGDSLTVNNSGPYLQGLVYKGVGTSGVITINNLILNGGLISHAQGNGDLFQLNGNISVTSASRIYAKQGPISLLAPISGSADLTVQNPDGGMGVELRKLRFLSPSNTFTGNLINNGRFELVDNSRLNFVIGPNGTNNVLSGTGAETTLSGDFAFNLTGASSNPGDSWNIVTAPNRIFTETFNIPGFSQSGSLWTNGTYLFNPATGVLSVSALPVQWNVNGGGNWNTGTNWLGNAVPGVGSDVQFDSVLTAPNAPASINLNVNATVNSVTFANANQYVFSGANTLTLTGLSRISSTSGTHVVGTVVAGTTGLTKTGAGDIILSANNTYTGTTNVQQGGLRVRNVGAVDGAANVDAGATLFFEGDGLGGGYNGTFVGNITGAGQVATSLTMTTETVTFNSAKTYTGQTTINNGTLQITGAGTLGTSDGTVASRTLVDGNSSTGKLALAGGIAVGNELLVLEGRELAAINSVHLTSSGNSSWAGHLKGEAGGTQYNIESTAGTLTLSGTISAPDTGVRNFVFSGSGDINITGKLVDTQSGADGVILPGPVNTANNVNLIKRGTGKLRIGTASVSGDDYWRGTTTVEAGTLEVLSDGGNNGELRGSSIAVQAGAILDLDSFSNYSLQSAQDLSGGGDIHAQTVSIFGDTLVSPGDNGAGTMTFRGAGGAGNANLYLGSDFFDEAGARGGLAFNLAGATTIGGGVNDLITGINNLTLDVQQYTNDFTPLGTDAPIELLISLSENQLANGGSGTYRLMNYSGTLTPVAHDQVSFAPQLQGIAGPIRQTLSVSTATDKQVNLVVTGIAATQTWVGNSNNVWDVNSSPNWTGTGNVFFNLDKVVFNDTAGANDTVSIGANVQPALVTFNSATSNTYTLTGTNAIVGNSDVALTGNVTAVVANNATNGLGDVNINTTAILQQGDGTSTGTTNVAGVVSGAGQVRVTSGALQLSGDNTYTGVTTINGGTLLIDSATALGNTSANTIVNGGTLRSNGDTFTVNEPITLNGGAFAVGGGAPAALIVAGNLTVGASGGTIQVDGNVGADGLTVTSNIVGSSAAALNANIDAGSNMIVTGNITNNGALNKSGGGSLFLSGTSTVTSPTINVNGGGMDVTGLAASTFTLGSGQTLNSNANFVGNVVAVSGSTASGSGNYANDVTAQSGSTIRIGGAGLATTLSQFVVDNFESYALGDVVNVASPPWTAHSASTFADIEDDGAGNKALTFGPATGASGVSRPIPLGGIIDNPEVATYFFRLNSKTDDPDQSFGLSDGVNTGAITFNDFETQVRAVDDPNAAGTFLLDARTGGTFSTLATGLTIDTWYNVWMVVDQTNDTYDVYMNTGTADATVANKVNLAPLAFRIGTTGPLNSLLGLSGAAPVDNAVRYDDVTFLSGADLNNPLSGLSPANVFQPEDLAIQGNLILNPGATLTFDIATPTALDTLNVVGNLGATGTLSVNLMAGAPAPQAGDAFNILDFGSASGAFQSFSLPGLASGLSWDTSSLLTTGVLSVVSGGQPGDFDMDGDVDGRDFLLWQRNPGIGNLADWQGNYGAGGPLTAAATAVPEPATWVCLLSVALASATLRRKS